MERIPDHQRLRRSRESGLFHDSRQDARVLATMCNILTDKVNELVDEVNALRRHQSPTNDETRG